MNRAVWIAVANITTLLILCQDARKSVSKIENSEGTREAKKYCFIIMCGDKLESEASQGKR